MRLISACLQPTQLSWLPVLNNVSHPSLHHKVTTDNMLQIIEGIQIGLRMLMSLSIHLHSLHLAQYCQK